MQHHKTAPASDTPPDEKKSHHRFTKKRASSENTDEVYSEKNIDHTIAAIYQDDNGEIPNMQRMTIQRSGSFARFFTFIFLIGIVGAVLAWTGFFFLPNSDTSRDQVSLVFEGPSTVELGATTTFKLVYGNDGTVDVTKLTLNVYYPEGFYFITSSKPTSNAGRNEWKLADLSIGKNAELLITGKFYGTPDEQKSWRAFLNYTPTNFNSELQKISAKNVIIGDSPLSLTMSGPDKASIGVDAAYSFAIEADTDWKGPLLLVPLVPTNFQISSSSPALDKNGRWNVVFTTSTPRPLFSLRGRFKDSTVTSTIKANLYVSIPTSNQLFAVAHTEITPEIAKNSIPFATAINGTTQDFDSHPGEKLAITVNLKNTSPDVMKNATISLIFDAPSVKRASALSWGQISDKNDGVIVGEQVSDTLRRGTITWTSKQIPALAQIQPNSTITFDLALPIKDTRDFDFSTSKENTIKVVTNATYLDKTNTTISTAASPITITLISDLAFENRDSVTTNSQSKEEHAVSWVLTNSYHDLKDITVTADIYGDTTFLAGSTSGGSMVFSAKDKRITWTIPSMPESIDVANGTFTLVVNAKNPTQNTLLSKVKIEATDTVAGKKILLSGNEIKLK